MMDVVILTAIASEFTAVTDALRATDPSSSSVPLLPARPPFRTCVAMPGSRTVAIAQSGVGLDRARSVTQWLVEHLEPKSVLVLGVAGGLTPELRVGDVVVASSIVGPGESLPVAAPDPRWFPIPESDDRRRVITAPMASAERIVRAPADKRALHAATGAAAVDMESLAVVEACDHANVPVHVVRVISDSAKDVLPREIESVLDPAGNPRFLHTGCLILRRPSLFGELQRVVRQSRIACHTLRELAAVLETPTIHSSLD